MCVHFISRAIEVSTEHIKKCWRLQSSGTLILKTVTLRYHFIPTKITKKGEKHQMLVRALRNRNAHPLLVGVCMAQVLWNLYGGYVHSAMPISQQFLSSVIT